MDIDRFEAAWQVWNEASKALSVAAEKERAAWDAWMKSKDVFMSSEGGE